MFFITVETLVDSDMTGHIEWHRHLADTEQGSKFPYNLYQTLIPHIWQWFSDESDGAPGETGYYKLYLYANNHCIHM